MGLKRAAGLLAAAMLAGAAPAGAAQGNGLIAYQRGGVFTIDPVSGASSLLHDGFSPAFSLDGTRIAFETSTPGGPFNIVVTGAGGSNPVQIGTTLAPRPLVWSPDGTRIAFVAGDSSSGFSIIVSKADGGGSSTRIWSVSSFSLPIFFLDLYSGFAARFVQIRLSAVKITSGVSGISVIIAPKGFRASFTALATAAAAPAVPASPAPFAPSSVSAVGDTT